MPDDSPPADPRETPYGRKISDPGALRALAHAGRYAILERLQTIGPATATECAQVAGLSPSACSYHLRLLAKHGFIEPDDSSDRANVDGRERVWRATLTGWWNAPEPDADPREVQATDSTPVAGDDGQLGRQGARLRRPRSAEREWRDAALFSNSTIIATVEELDALGRSMMDLLRPLMQTNRPLGQHPTAPGGAPGDPDGPPPPGAGRLTRTVELNHGHDSHDRGARRRHHGRPDGPQPGRRRP